MYDAMDNVTRNRGKQETVAQLVTGLAAAQPLLVTVEDVHWADPLTLGHLASLAGAVNECAAILVLTSRVESDPLDDAWRASVRGSAFLTLDLGPLREDDALALAGGFTDASRQFVRDCVARAEGNPLFLEQLLRSAEESGQDNIPGSIHSLVLARMDRLPPLDRRASQAASVIGQQFSGDVLGHLLDAPGYDCAELVTHYLVRPEGTDYLFTHALIREALYSSMVKRRRHTLHRRAADWYAERDATLLAEHLDRAEDPAAARAYLAAAQSEMGHYHYERARKLVERGLEVGAGGDAFDLRCLLGDILAALGEIAASIAAYREALAQASEEAQRCHAWIGLAAGMRVSDDYDGALAALDEAEALATGGDLTLERARLHHLRGNIFFPLGDLAACGEQHRLALECATRVGSAELEAQALSGLGDECYGRGHMRSAHGYFRRCLDLCRVGGFGRIEVANLPMLAWSRFYLVDLEGALNDAGAAVQGAARVGHHRAEIVSNNIQCQVLGERGDGPRVRDCGQRSLDLARQIGARRFGPMAMFYIAKGLLLGGPRREAITVLRDALAISREAGHRFTGGIVLGGLASATDDDEERSRVLDEGERLLAEGCVAHNYFLFYRDAIESCMARGDGEGVVRYADALEAYTSGEPLPWSNFLIARARALAAWGRGARDAASLAELARLRDQAASAGLGPLRAALDEAAAPRTPE